MKSVPVIVIQLVHILGPMKGEIQEFAEGAVMIGRDPVCNLQFPPDLAIISRRHAHIIREGNQFKLVDTSSNGTFVNGKRVKEAYLKNGDVLEFAEGGPKVSFLSEMKQMPAAIAVAPPPPPPPPPQEQKAEPPRQPVQAPVYTPPEMPKPVQPEVVQPMNEPRGEVSVQKVSAPLIIQYGPTLRSYRELPVIMGKGPKCDFVLEHPAIYEQHAQIFFAQDRYWIKDLTGQQPLRINGRPVSVQSPMNVNDEISMSAQGPVFRFLGEGRLAEVEQAAPAPLPRQEKSTETHAASEEKSSGNLFSRFKKFLDK